MGVVINRSRGQCVIKKIKGSVLVVYCFLFLVLLCLELSLFLAIMSSKRVAVVTGSNKGIGLAIVRSLCKKFDGDVVLTSRDEGRGNEAVAELKGKEGLNPVYHQLDITSRDSIEGLVTFIKDQYGGLDVLINNAGIAYKAASTGK